MFSDRPNRGSRPLKALHLAALSAFFVPAWCPQNALGQSKLEQNIENCRGLATAEARLKCYEALPLGTAPTEAAPSQWRLVRSRSPDGETVSMMHTADTARSDPDFAGLSIRCGKDGPDYILIIVSPLPPRARLTVTVVEAGKPLNLSAVLLPSGAAIRLSDAQRLANGPWQTQQELSVTIGSGDRTLQGVVPLTGFSQALRQLTAACPSH